MPCKFVTFYRYYTATITRFFHFWLWYRFQRSMSKMAKIVSSSLLIAYLATTPLHFPCVCTESTPHFSTFTESMPKRRPSFSSTFLVLEVANERLFGPTEAHTTDSHSRVMRLRTAVLHLLWIKMFQSHWKFSFRFLVHLSRLFLLISPYAISQHCFCMANFWVRTPVNSFSAILLVFPYLFLYVFSIFYTQA